MDYLTNYYKNLCEELQQRIDLLEAGLKGALRSGKPARMKRELAKRRERLKAKPESEGLKAGIEHLAMPLEIEHGIRTGIRQSELPQESPFGSDRDEPVQIRPYPTPAEMTRLFMLKRGR